MGNKKKSCHALLMLKKNFKCDSLEDVSIPLQPELQEEVVSVADVRPTTFSNFKND